MDSGVRRNDEQNQGFTGLDRLGHWSALNYHMCRSWGFSMSATSTSMRFGALSGFGWRVVNALQLLFTIGWTTVLLPFALLLLLLCGGRRHWPLRMASRIWAPGLLRGAGARLQIEGFDTVDFSKPCIVVANHQSMIDVCVLFRALPVPLCFVMKDELAKVPVVGIYARAMGMVFIERGAAREATRRMKRASALFAAGLSVCGFPEGTRSRHGEVGQFKGGIFKFAIENGMPILPVAIQGSGAVLPANGFRVRPGRIRIRAGELIETRGLQQGDRMALAARCRDAVIALRDVSRI